MKFGIDFGLYNGMFAVPDIVVDKHLKLSNGATLKVLLVLLRHSGEELEAGIIGEYCNLSTAEVKDALAFWADQGLLDESVREIPIQPRVYEVKEKLVEKASQSEPAAIVAEELPKAKDKVAAKNMTILSSSPQRPTQKEAAARMRQSGEIRFIITETGAVLGRDLNGNEISSLVMLYDWGRIPADILMTVVHFCKTIGFSDMRRIEKVAWEFIDRGITTHEDAEAYIFARTEAHNNKNKVKTAFGIGGRNLSTNEEKYVARWFEEYGFSIDIVKLAYDQGIDKTAKLSFAYIDKILSNWHEKKVTTVEQAQAEINSKPGKRKAKSEERKYTNTSYDINQLEQDSINTIPKL